MVELGYAWDHRVAGMQGAFICLSVYVVEEEKQWHLFSIIVLYPRSLQAPSLY